VWTSESFGIGIKPVFMDNTATRGGAIFGFSSSITVNLGSPSYVPMVVHKNRASLNGGGIYLQGGGISTALSVESNIAGENGGGIYLDSAFVSIGGIVANNSATSLGGGLFVTASKGSLENRLSGQELNVIQNGATNGGGMFVSNTKFGWNFVEGHFEDNMNADIVFDAASLDFCQGCPTSDCKSCSGLGTCVSWGNEKKLWCLNKWYSNCSGYGTCSISSLGGGFGTIECNCQEGYKEITTDSTSSCEKNGPLIPYQIIFPVSGVLILAIVITLVYVIYRRRMRNGYTKIPEK